MARFKKQDVPGVEFIEDLAIKAAKDPEALKELGRLAEKLGRRANQNIRELEKRDFESDAYKYAKSKLGTDKPRYSQAHAAKSETAGESAMILAENAIQAATFLRYQTSTVGGVRAKSRKGFQKLLSKAVEKREKATGEEMTSTEKKKYEAGMTKFLNSKALDELRVLGSDIIDKTAEAIEQGANIDDLLNAYKDYENGDFDGGIITVWDNWFSPYKE